ncbi:MAG: MarR family transcriptional regulator [Actinomycetia bacterium]|nr:MarR family transcriptional regulator [Actinomycetes bacterium]
MPGEATSRDELVSLMVDDVRALASEADHMGRLFADAKDLGFTDFLALRHILVAQTARQPITSGVLGQLFEFSASAITSLVNRLIDRGYVRRELDCADRRKVRLFCTESGQAVLLSFFDALRKHACVELVDLSDADLGTVHRGLTALIVAMCHFRSDMDAPVVRKRLFRKEQFRIDLAAGTVSCPAGHTVTIGSGRRYSSARFGVLCDSCPLRAECTTARSGRVITLHAHEAALYRSARSPAATG